MNAAKNGINHKGVGNAMKTTRHTWKSVASGLLIGLLVAGSASSHIERASAASTTSTASPKAPGVYGADQRLRLPDDRRLDLSADGTRLTLWDKDLRRVIRTQTIPDPRIDATMTLLPSGRVLIWGGASKSGILQLDGLWFDPQLNAVEPARNLPMAARAGHTATVLTDGRVLFAGGRSATSKAQIWSEAGNRLVEVESALAARVDHRAQLQANGRVRIYGGHSANAPVNGDLVFDPVANAFAQAGPGKDAAAVPAPGLAASLPAQAAKDVAPDQPLSIRFTEPVRMPELNPSNVLLLGPGGAAHVRITAAEDGRLAFITPRQALFPGSAYTLMVDGVHTRSGRKLPLVAIDFKTAALPAEAGEPAALGEITHAPPPGEAVAGASECAQNTGRPFPCRVASTLENGVWTPGRDNTDGRWRIAGVQPELRPTALMGDITKALGYTTLIGRVLRVDSVPVANVDVSIGSVSTRTDANGDFILYNAPAGRQELYVDGSSANGRNLEYGQFVVGVDVKAGTLNQLPYTMYLPRITARDKIRISSPLTRDLVLKHPDMPGLMVQIPAGTVLRDRKGRLVRELAIVPTPVNRAPFPVADNYPMYFTLEPGGAVIQGLTPEAAKGIRVFYPNYDGHPKGTQANFWIYDPAQGWQIYGKGRVTSDGKYFSPEAGVALHQTMGGSYSVSPDEPPSEPDTPPCSEACGSSGSGAGATAGDPIDLYTGEFSYAETDLAVRDIVPISVARSYRPRDLKKREFGIGTAANFNFKIHSPGGSSNYTALQLVLPGGMPVDFQRISGSGYTGRWIQSGSSNAYTGARLEFMNDSLGAGYRLTTTGGDTMHFGNLAPNPIRWKMDRHGNRIDYVYEAGLLTRIVSASGRFISLEYDTDNRIKTVRDPLGNAWTYLYNGTGLLRQVNYPDGTNRKYNYRIHSVLGSPLKARLESIYDQKNQRVLLNEFETVGLNDPGYDGSGWSGRVVKQTQADGGIINLQYGHVVGTTVGTLVTNPDGSKRRVVFDPVSRYPSSDTIAYGTALAQTTAFERNAAGLITARIDSIGRRTEYQYDSRGNVTQVKFLPGSPDQRTVSMAYTNEGDLASITDPLNRVTTLGYTGRCLTSVQNPLNEITRFTCSLTGQPSSVTDPLGHTTALQYLGYELDRVVDPLGRSVGFRYDRLGRPIATQDAQGNISRTEYDINGRIWKSIDAAGGVTQTGYDANGNVTAVLLPHGNGLTYTYDSRDRLLTRTDSLGQVESWTYDLMDRVQTYTDRKGQVTTFTYGVLGRTTGVQYHDTSTVAATYDAANRLRTLVDSASGTLSWDYDALDQVIQAVTPQGSVTYEYDAAGRRIGMLAANQPKVEYRYDAADRLTRLLQGSEIVQHAYDAAGRLIRTTLPNNVKTGYAYNSANELTGLAWLKPDDTLLGDLGYGYDSVGRLVAQTGSHAPQALSAASTGANQFDDNQRQTRFNGQTLSYDANGNLTGDGVRTYVWNARDQLVAIQQGASTVASFGYDAQGRRHSRTEGGQTTTYLYDGLDAVQETVGATVNPILTGLGIDQRHARNDSGGRTYFLTDALGSTRALTNASGAVVQRYDYTPYGETTQTASGFSNPYQYTGRERDDSGLYYYPARYYNAGMGRFIAEDPIGLAGGLNWYACVEGNPISYIDPTGEIGVPGLIAGGIIGGISGAFGAYANGGNVWAGFGVGAATGAAVGVTGQYVTGVLGHMALRAAMGAAGNAAGQYLNSGDPCGPGFSWWSLGGSMVGGALGGFLAPGAWGTSFTGSLAAQVGQRAIAGIPGAGVSGTFGILGTQIGKQNAAKPNCGCP